MVKNILYHYIEEHEQPHESEYRLQSSVQTGETEYKFKYYTRDPQFREIDVFFTISYDQEIKCNFSEKLSDSDIQFMKYQAIQHILYVSDYDTLLSSDEIGEYIESKAFRLLKPLDYRNILDYLQYHKGIDVRVCDSFYEIFMPYLNQLIENDDYDDFMDSIELILDKILYEYIWDGIDSSYLDTQYQFHLYYVREIIQLMYKNLEGFYTNTRAKLLATIWRITKHQRFALSIMTDFGPLLLENVNFSNSMMRYIEMKNRESGDTSLVYPYFDSILESNADDNREATKNILRFLIEDMLSFANHDLQEGIGYALIQSNGYDILTELFQEDYNTYIFQCFPISSFPEEYKKDLRVSLEQAIRFYAGRMNSELYRLSSFEQVYNINRLLLEDFRDN